MDRRTGIAVGVDVAEARKGLDLVAIDDQRRVLAVHSHLTIDGVVAHIAGLRPDIVCIDSPAQWSTSGNSRLAERELGRGGINSFRTPSEERAGPFHAWMTVGMTLYDAVASTYPRFRGGDVVHTAAEFFPHASAVVLAGSVHARKDKPMARRRVLEDHGVSTASLTTMDQLDAALGALTGHLALAGKSSFVGDPDEGALLLPAPEPLARIPRAPTPPTAPSHAVGSRRCACGCGAPVRSEFLPGHDAKLRSRLRSEVRNGAAAAEELQRGGWQ